MGGVRCVFYLGQVGVELPVFRLQEAFQHQGDGTEDEVILLLQEKQEVLKMIFAP